MRQKSENKKPSSDGLRGEHSMAELCRREGIAESLYCDWSKEFLETGKRWLARDTARAGARLCLVSCCFIISSVSQFRFSGGKL
jgi:hypothetical protein